MHHPSAAVPRGCEVMPSGCLKFKSEDRERCRVDKAATTAVAQRAKAKACPPSAGRPVDMIAVGTAQMRLCPPYMFSPRRAGDGEDEERGEGTALTTAAKSSSSRSRENCNSFGGSIDAVRSTNPVPAADSR